MYRKLKRTWSHSDLNYIPNFRKLFPELSRVSSEELADRFIDLNLDFYTEEKTPVTFWRRITMPFAIIALLLMLLGIPILFLFTGRWYYQLGKNNHLLNWFKSLRLQ